MLVSNKFIEDNSIAVPGIDTWYGTTINLVEDKLGLSPSNDGDSSTTIINYDIEDSDTFSRVYSKINKSPDFTYIDNESSYDDTTISLVYEIPGGKATLFGNLATDYYDLKVVRD